MPFATIELVIVILLIIVNGVFAMSETAFVSARKVRLQQRANEGDTKALAALEMANAPNRLLSTVQLGLPSSASSQELLVAQRLPRDSPSISVPSPGSVAIVMPLPLPSLSS